MLLPPAQPATCSLRASSCIFDKVIGIFLLTGLSLHFTCYFPGPTASSGQQVWLGSPSPHKVWGRTHQFLFILSLGFPVVEGKADVRRRRGLRRQCWGPRAQGERGERARDRGDLLALGSPAQDPRPAPKASTAPRPSHPLLQPGPHHRLCLSPTVCPPPHPAPWHQPAYVFTFI